MLTQTQVEQFKRDGFLRGSQVLTAAQVDELTADMERILEKFKDGTENAPGPKPVMCKNIGKNPAAPVWQLVNIYNASEPFTRLVFNQKVTEEIAQLMGTPEVRMWHDQIQYKPAETGGVNMWHQDAPYWPVITPMTQVTAWVALDDVDEANGCMSMVPGSHLWGNQIEFLHTIKNFEDMPKEFEGKPIQVKTCPVKKGEVHFHHALTWHGSNKNTSGRKRRAIALHYMPGDSRYVAAGKHVMQSFITAKDGEVIRDAAFPVVWPR
jgi:ectoine hydroxylase-related dioxygenase (phytanoyl-CoA dioxygenase family)